MRLSCDSPAVPVLVVLIGLVTLGTGAVVDDFIVNGTDGSKDSEVTTTNTSTSSTTTYTLYTPNTSSIITNSTNPVIEELVKITGTLQLTVSDAANFASNSEVRESLKEGIAAALGHLGVTSSMVTILSVTVSRRLSRAVERQLQAGQVSVQYEINAPASSSAAQITSSDIETSGSSFQTQINAALVARNVQGASVTGVTVLPVTINNIVVTLTTTTTAPSSQITSEDDLPGNSNERKVGLTPLPLWQEIAIAACAVLLLFGLVGYGYWRTNRKVAVPAVESEPPEAAATPRQVRQTPQPWPSPPARLFQEEISEEGRGFGEEPEGDSEERSEGYAIPDERTILAWLRSVYGRYNPGKLSQVEDLFNAHRGRERELIEKVVRKYRLGTEAQESTLRSSACCIPDKPPQFERGFTADGGRARQ